jgi:hypothetical protein
MPTSNPQVVITPPAGVVAIAATTETVVGQCVVSTDAPRQVSLFGTVQYTPGAAATGCVLRVRRNSLTGSVVGQPTGALNVIASVPNDLQVSVVDGPGEVAGQIYVLTCTPVGGANAASASFAQIEATID